MVWKSKRKCIDPKIGALMASYELGLLAPEDRAKFETHAFHCDLCFEELYSFQTCAETIKAAPERVYPEPISQAEERKMGGRVRTGILLSRLAYAVGLFLLLILVWAIHRINGLQKQIHSLRESHAHQQEKLSRQLDQLAREKREYLAELNTLKNRSANRVYTNTFSYTLEISAMRSLEENEAVHVPQGAQLLNLALRLPRGWNYDSYRVEIRDDSGELIVDGHGLKKNKYQMLQLAVPMDLLSTKKYGLKIYGIDQRKTELIAEHSFHILRR